MKNLAQRVIIVTGGSKGIGKSICKVFIQNGDKVVINYNKSSKDAEDLKNDLSNISSDVSIYQADVSNYAQVKQMVENVDEVHGKIDVLINNAGIVRDCYIMLMSGKDWNDVVNINLTGVFNCSKAVSEYMIERRNGVIINVASLSGITGLAGQTNYSASKGGVIAFTKALSKELAPFNVRVNAVAPGVIETDVINSISNKAKNRFLENIPLKRFGKPEEVASVVKFLASQDAGYITGEVICVTGGLP